jgi:hypothetical protein
MSSPHRCATKAKHLAQTGEKDSTATRLPAVKPPMQLPLRCKHPKPTAATAGLKPQVNSQPAQGSTQHQVLHSFSSVCTTRAACSQQHTCLAGHTCCLPVERQLLLAVSRVIVL